MKKMLKKRRDLGDLKSVITSLQWDEPLADCYHDHPLKGNKRGYWDCHPDRKALVLIYAKKEQYLILAALIEDDEIKWLKF